MAFARRHLAEFALRRFFDLRHQIDHPAGILLKFRRLRVGRSSSGWEAATPQSLSRKLVGLRRTQS